ncbi:Glutathione S-transferase S1 [Mortierella sp. GBA30]|nr:Glutathione S-transferase S1 [Mortierella sp. GBA30]
MSPTDPKPHYRFFQPESSTDEASLILCADRKDIEFELMYFDFTCMAATARHILSFGKANWHDRFPIVWKTKEEFECPFGVMPVLNIKSEQGIAMVAETIVIDFFLAKKFDLLGANEYEEQVIKSFYSSIHYLRERCLMRMTWTYADKRQEAFESFVTKLVPWWIRVHEQHLENNGSNGHFFGEKITLADIHMVSVLDHFTEIPRGDEIVALFMASPLITKVWDTVIKNPEISAWRSSDGFRKVHKGGKRTYSVTAF